KFVIVLRRSVSIVLIGLLGGIFLLGPTSCNFTAKNSKIKDAKLAQAIKDSLRLVYDADRADPQIHEYMSRLHQRSGFNGNVLVAKNGEIVYQNTMGWANRLMRDSLQITSQFELASVSKPITATG